MVTYTCKKCNLNFNKKVTYTEHNKECNKTLTLEELIEQNKKLQLEINALKNENDELTKKYDKLQNVAGNIHYENELLRQTGITQNKYITIIVSEKENINKLVSDVLDKKVNSVSVHDETKK